MTEALPDSLVVFGDLDLSNRLYVSDVTRTIAPTRRFTQTDVPGLDGQLVSPNGMEPLEITVTGHIKEHLMQDVAEARKSLAASLMSSEPQKLILGDDQETYMMAYYKGGAAPSRLMHCPDVELTFLCADPVSFGAAHVQELRAGSPTQVAAGGTYKALPVVECTPSEGSTWRLSNWTTGEYIQVDAPFDGSDKLVLDFATQRCTVNGADHAVTLGSDYFPLTPLAQELRCTSAATLTWNERWL